MERVYVRMCVKERGDRGFTDEIKMESILVLEALSPTV